MRKAIPTPSGPFQVIVSADELASYLGCHRNTINNWDRNGVIKGMRDEPRMPGRGQCFLRYDLWEVLQTLKRNAA